ncbi:DNA polymerase III subunit delta [Wolbachia endosymbiont of Brugia malayi]|uniref:DNA polymerase III subunit delta n=1 Tax=Wolbachia endosymbiont of Brugia malayi TaxID=80849 RepID=UPI00004C92C0|nr:DNA polymerase III subunit delta [Wolbachia endosymbiont of Brugia malayi]AAW70767.1 DNA polymerase III delta subunit [Wolbachia endosymbiont strain TRS of Brugia malayi]QCB61740.1 DNA polymerase III subunit delta [Wolbachia endosymbiont of Brugia malayi]
MKVTPSKVKKFLEKPDILSGVLIHGNDNSKVDFFTQEIVASLSEYSVQMMDFAMVNKSPGLLFSELANISMFTSKKLIKLINVTGNISKELKNVLDYNAGGHYVIMIATDLSYNSTIKSYIESSKTFGVIACYKNSGSNLYDIISSYLKRNDIKYTNEIIYHLQSYFNYSNLPIHSELEKLVLYLGERKDLKPADIELCLSTFSNDYVTPDNLCSAIANKDMANFIKISDTLILQENFSPIGLIRIISNYFLSLEKVLLSIQGGMNEQVAIDQLNPPLFFKQLQSFKSHLKIFQLSELKKILESLISLEITCKKTDLDHRMIFQHALQMADIGTYS